MNGLNNPFFHPLTFLSGGGLLVRRRRKIRLGQGVRQLAVREVVGVRAQRRGLHRQPNGLEGPHPESSQVGQTQMEAASAAGGSRVGLALSRGIWLC